MKRAALLSVLLAIAMLAMPASALAFPADFWGVVPAGSATATQLRLVKEGGVESVRVPINWSAVQSSRGALPDWSSIDPTVEAAAEAGCKRPPLPPRSSRLGGPLRRRRRHDGATQPAGADCGAALGLA